MWWRAGLLAGGRGPGRFVLLSESGSGDLLLPLTAEAPVLFRKKLEPQTVEERSSVTMEVELTCRGRRSSGHAIPQHLASGEKVEIHAEGARHRLVLHSLGFADRGFYGCGHQRQDAGQADCGKEQLSELVQGLSIEEVEGWRRGSPSGGRALEKGKRGRRPPALGRGRGGGEGSEEREGAPQGTVRLPRDGQGLGPRPGSCCSGSPFLVCPVVRCDPARAGPAGRGGAGSRARPPWK